MKRFEFQVDLKAITIYDKEAKVYVSKVPALNILSQGETVLEAEEAIKDAVVGFLEVSHNLKNKD